MPLQKLGNEQGYLKAGFLGYAKSGKTYTATKLAIGVKKFFNLPGPIGFFDTESGSGYVAEIVQRETGQEMVGTRARSLKDLLQFGRDCVQEKVSVAIIDSITHPWKEVCDSYLAQLNEKRREKNWAPMMKLEFQHWAAIKNLWQEWPDFFLNSPLHIIVCGRAGAIWEFDKDPETGKKELVKAGTKMKVETEFSFESSLLVEMEREQIPDGNGGFKIIHTATVLGDRFAVLDGVTQVNPDFNFFKPHIEKLRSGSHAPVNIASKTQTGADVEGGVGWDREKRERAILAEEIQGAIVTKYPGQSADDKRAKAELLQLIFSTRSWTKVENLNSEQLRDGFERLRKHLGIDQGQPVSTSGTEDDLPFENLPQAAPEAPGGVNTPTTTQTPQGGPVVAELPPLQRIRGFLKESPTGIQEVELIATLIALGSLESGIANLDQAALLRPDLLKTVADSWGIYQKSCEQFRAQVKATSK